MKRQIRCGVFESNSSSTHTLTICSEAEFEAWRKGEVLFDRWSDKFVALYEMSEDDKENAHKEYEDAKADYWKDWNTLSEEEKEKWYKKYASDHHLKDEDLQTYDEYMGDYYLETYSQSYTTKSGDRVIAFGKYGYDG